MKFILILLSLTLSMQVMCQEEKAAAHLPVLKNCAELKKPQICTSKHLQAFISKVKYPRAAKKAKAEGEVMVSFVVDTSGSVTEISVKESSGFDILDNAAIEHISKMPQWIPGNRNGEVSPTLLTVPVNFKL